MESLAGLSCVLCIILLISVEQLNCMPFVLNTKNSTRSKLVGRKSSFYGDDTSARLNETSNMKGRLLSYEDLPDDGSMDEEFEKQNAANLDEGMWNLYFRCLRANVCTTVSYNTLVMNGIGVKFILTKHEKCVE